MLIQDFDCNISVPTMIATQVCVCLTMVPHTLTLSYSTLTHYHSLSLPFSPSLPPSLHSSLPSSLPPADSLALGRSLWSPPDCFPFNNLWGRCELSRCAWPDSTPHGATHGTAQGAVHLVAHHVPPATHTHSLTLSLSHTHTQTHTHTHTHIHTHTHTHTHT